MKSRSPNLALLAFAIPFLVILAPASAARAGWSLVWSDEFEGDALDGSNWNIEVGDGCPELCGFGNNELQWYGASNVQVRDGHLVLTARRERIGDHHFTSGKITTEGKQSFLYGRIEARAKLPTGEGMWPAFWMLPEEDVYGGWAASGEIDIVESIHETDHVSGTLHFGGHWPENTLSGGEYSPGLDFADDFHVYAIEWEPDEIRWYVDGVLYSRKTTEDWYSTAAPDEPRAPFDQAFHLILNTAVGGDYPGCTSPKCITAVLPQEFLIDYVRVYEDVPPTGPKR